MSYLSMAQKPHSLEYTAILNDGRVFHYTCNPPSNEILTKHGIEAIGNKFGCKDSREVLLIPKSLYKSYGYVVRESDIKIVSEQLLRRL